MRACGKPTMTKVPLLFITYVCHLESRIPHSTLFFLILLSPYVHKFYWDILTTSSHQLGYIMMLLFLMCVLTFLHMRRLENCLLFESLMPQLECNVEVQDRVMVSNWTHESQDCITLDCYSLLVHKLNCTSLKVLIGTHAFSMTSV